MAGKEFVQAWLLPPTPPESKLVNTGDQRILVEQTEVFFEATENYLGVTNDHRRAQVVKHKRYDLVVLAEEEKDKVISEQFITLLQVGDLTVASALELRNDHNYFWGQWASYLTPEREAMARRRLDFSSDIIFTDE